MFQEKSNNIVNAAFLLKLVILQIKNRINKINTNKIKN